MRDCVQIPSGIMQQIVMLDGTATVCSISPSGQYVLCNSNEFMMVYDLYTVEHVCTAPIAHRPSLLTFTHDGQRAYIACASELGLTILKMNKVTKPKEMWRF
jgi:hypothetical protein